MGPESDGYLRAVEELAGEGDHAVHEISLDKGFADVTFTGLVGGHAAIGKDEASTGLGLSIVKDLITRNDGRIEVTSVEGKGTTFTVFFPIRN
mgnify:FL=1